MSLNKVILIGNVGKDPEVRYFDTGKAVANFTLATNERKRVTSNGVQIPERTEWHTIVVWKGLAEIAEKYIRKGSKVYVEGKIRTRSYDDAQGMKRSVTEIVGDNLILLDRKLDTEQSYSSSILRSTTTLPTQPDSYEKEDDDDLPF